MTTISQIINDAYRESNLIANGATPTANELDEALRLLNRYVMSLFGYELGEPLETIALGRGNITTPDNVPLYMDDLIAYYVPENTRLQANLTSSQTINLPPSPKDGARLAIVDNGGNFGTYNLILNGNGRQIEGGHTLTLATDGLVREWFYREDLGAWVRLASLELTDDSPFPQEFDDLLVLGLQYRINPRNGTTVDPQSQDYFASIRKKFKARYRQFKEMPVEQGLVRLPGNKAIRGTLDSNRNFDRGVPQW